MDDLRQLINNMRHGTYWTPIASRYNLIGTKVNRKNCNVEPISSIEYSALQIYTNLVKYEYADDTIVA